MPRERIFKPRWEINLTNSMAASIRIAAANEGIARSEWIRQACRERLEREGRVANRRKKSA